MLVHSARQKVAGDPVLLINLTVSSSFTKPKMTEGSYMLQTALLPSYEVYRYRSSKQSYLSQKPLGFPVLHIRTLSHQSNSQNTRNRHFCAKPFLYTQYSKFKYQMLPHSLSNIFMYTTDPFQEPGISQLLFLLQCGQFLDQFNRNKYLFVQSVFRHLYTRTVGICIIAVNTMKYLTGS